MKPNFNLALIDGDIIGYRCSIASQELPESVCGSRIDEMMEYCLNQTVDFYTEENYRVFLTGSNNFRYDVAKTYDYKGNRRDTEKPKHLEFARQHLTEKWGATTSEGCEADDLIATVASQAGDGCVIVSQDKDFNTVKGWKFNFVNGNWRYDTKETALEFFYTQILTGDTADNIVGLFRIGPKKAAKIIEGATTEEELFSKCLQAYKESPTLVGDPYERLIENARLLHLQRNPLDIWEPPSEKPKV